MFFAESVRRSETGVAPALEVDARDQRTLGLGEGHRRRCQQRVVVTAGADRTIKVSFSCCARAVCVCVMFRIEVQFISRHFVVGSFFNRKSAADLGFGLRYAQADADWTHQHHSRVGCEFAFAVHVLGRRGQESVVLGFGTEQNHSTLSRPHEVSPFCSPCLC